MGWPPGSHLGLLNLARRAVSLLFFVAFPVVLATYRLAPVQGASMEPTLSDGQTVCYQALPPALLPLGRGDLVVFESPMDPSHRYVKRLVGLPGDELRFQYGLLQVNGQALELPEGAVDPEMVLSARVPPDCFFALGDHGAVSYDSRRFGPVPMERLIGRLVYTLP